MLQQTSVPHTFLLNIRPYGKIWPSRFLSFRPYGKKIRPSDFLTIRPSGFGLTVQSEKYNALDRSAAMTAFLNQTFDVIESK